MYARREDPGVRWNLPFDVPRDANARLAGNRFILFDGACGFCTWIVRTIRGVDLEGRFRFLPYQYLTPGDLAYLGVTAERCAREVVYADGRGTVLGGAAAVNALVIGLPTTRLALTFGALSLLPLLLRAESALYRTVATHRAPISRLLGTTGEALIDEPDA